MRRSTFFLQGRGEGGGPRSNSIFKKKRRLIFIFFVTLQGKFYYFEFSRGFWGRFWTCAWSVFGTCGRNRLFKSINNVSSLKDWQHKLIGVNKDSFWNKWTGLDHWQTTISTGVKRSNTCSSTFTPTWLTCNTQEQSFIKCSLYESINTFFI